MGYHVLVIGYRLLAGLRGLSGVFLQIFSLETLCALDSAMFNDAFVR